MIDMHSHILPNIDDGARNVQEAFDMIQEAHEAGFDSIVSTSHYIEGAYDSNKEQREKIIQAIQKKLEQKGIPITIYNGAEAYAIDDIQQLIKENKVPTIHNSRYLLMELPMHVPILCFPDIIYQLLSDGITPIIAHPERYFYVQENPNQLIEWIQMGALLQANYGSIIGIYGKREKDTVVQLLKHDMIHFLGTDCHRKQSVYIKMEQIQKQLKKILTRERLEQLSTQNPLKVIRNEKIVTPKPKEIKKRRFNF